MIASESWNRASILTTGVAKQLLVHNISVNGLRAVIYCYGLSASRYIEYGGALAYLSPGAGCGETILEVGCGHSILPTFWQKLGVETIVVDTNREALRWQTGKSKRKTGTIASAVLADMRYLPFKNESIKAISCISAIEHVPDDGDIDAASEIGRILKNNGVYVISIPLSASKKSHVERHWATGIPQPIQNLLHPCLPAILREFKVDRTSSYFERLFSMDDVGKRIIIPSNCTIQDYFVLRSTRMTKTIYQKMIPTGFLALLEHFMTRFLAISRSVKDADAIVLKSKKGEPQKRQEIGREFSSSRLSLEALV